MYGPKFEVTDGEQTVVLRDILPRDVGTLPYHVDAKLTQHLSKDASRDVRDIIGWGVGARVLRRMRDEENHMAWGQYASTSMGETLVGYTGFNHVQSPVQGVDARWKQAASYMVLLNGQYIGENFATLTHPHRTVFGLGLGIDCLQSSVAVDNERSRRSLLRVGYVELGTDPETTQDDKRWTHFRLYSPELAEQAVDHALSYADQLENKTLTPDVVRAAQHQVHDLQQSLPEVQKAAEQWLADHGRETLFVPKSV